MTSFIMAGNEISHKIKLHHVSHFSHGSNIPNKCPITCKSSTLLLQLSLLMKVLTKSLSKGKIRITVEKSLQIKFIVNITLIASMLHFIL